MHIFNKNFNFKIIFSIAICFLSTHGSSTFAMKSDTSCPAIQYHQVLQQDSVSPKETFLQAAMNLNLEGVKKLIASVDIQTLQAAIEALNNANAHTSDVFEYIAQFLIQKHMHTTSPLCSGHPIPQITSPTPPTNVLNVNNKINNMNNDYLDVINNEIINLVKQIQQRSNQIQVLRQDILQSQKQSPTPFNTDNFFATDEEKISREIMQDKEIEKHEKENIEKYERRAFSKTIKEASQKTGYDSTIFICDLIKNLFEFLDIESIKNLRLGNKVIKEAIDSQLKFFIVGIGICAPTWKVPIADDACETLKEGSVYQECLNICENRTPALNKDWIKEETLKTYNSKGPCQQSRSFYLLFDSQEENKNKQEKNLTAQLENQTSVKEKDFISFIKNTTGNAKFLMVDHVASTAFFSSLLQACENSNNFKDLKVMLYFKIEGVGSFAEYIYRTENEINEPKRADYRNDLATLFLTRNNHIKKISDDFSQKLNFLKQKSSNTYLYIYLSSQELIDIWKTIKELPNVFLDLHFANIDFKKMPNDLLNVLAKQSCHLKKLTIIDSDRGTLNMHNFLDECSETQSKKIEKLDIQISDDDDYVKDFGLLINNANNGKLKTLRIGSGEILCFDEFTPALKCHEPNNTVKKIFIDNVTIDGKSIFDIFNKFKKLEKIMIKRSFLFNLNFWEKNDTTAIFSPYGINELFPSVKIIYIENEDVDNICETHNFFSLQSLGILLKTCPNLKSLSIVDGLLLQDLSNDLKHLSDILKKHAHVITKLGFWATGEFINVIRKNKKYLTKYKKQLAEDIEKAFNSAGISKKIVEITIPSKIFDEKAINEFNYFMTIEIKDKIIENNHKNNC